MVTIGRETAGTRFEASPQPILLKTRNIRTRCQAQEALVFTADYEASGSRNFFRLRARRKKTAPNPTAPPEIAPPMAPATAFSTSLNLGNLLWTASNPCACFSLDDEAEPAGGKAGA